MSYKTVRTCTIFSANVNLHRAGKLEFAARLIQNVASASARRRPPNIWTAASYNP